MVEALVCFFKNLFRDVVAYAVYGGGVSFLGLVERGIAQGCPSSGFIFAAAIDCGMWLLAQRIVDPGLGLAFACADDIGCVLKSLRAFCICAEIFERIEQATTLSLSITQTNLVPV